MPSRGSRKAVKSARGYRRALRAASRSKEHKAAVVRARHSK